MRTTVRKKSQSRGWLCRPKPHSPALVLQYLLPKAGHPGRSSLRKCQGLRSELYLPVESSRTLFIDFCKVGILKPGEKM